ncbi:MAG: hypothetical protein JWR88_784 [Pseudonocardia sp.]|nr:hypothetical protein [Pseudonocardia sp.]
MFAHPVRRRGELRATLLVVCTLMLLCAGGAGAGSAAQATGLRLQSGSHRSPSVRGEISSIEGDRWTVTDNRGGIVEVTLTEETLLGTQRQPMSLEQFAVGVPVAVTGTRTGNSIAATRVIKAGSRTNAARSAPPAAPTPPTTAAVPVTCVVSADLDSAVAYATAQGERAAIAVYDTASGRYFYAGDSDEPYSSASVVKVLIAAELLLTGQMTGSTESTASQMIISSDDDAADALYGLVGGDGVITTIAAHYGITNLGSPPADAGQWGETKITADGLVHLYAALKADPTVWPWLSQTMKSTTQLGADGTDQYFGLPSASQDWSVKQGWMTGLGPGSTYLSTGFVQDNRYAVAILTYGSTSQYGAQMSDTITQMAKDVMPAGQIGAPSGASAACTP